MKKQILFTLLVTLVFYNKLCAWDEVTHAYMTSMIPELVEDAELQRILTNNFDEFIYGCWFTDTYQYTNNRIDKLNPHNIETYGRAFTNYLKKPEVMEQSNYEKLVAVYLGSLAHITEDFWYDSNLVHYQKTKTDKFKGDSKHGAFVIKQNGYLCLQVKRYFPNKDLFKMYAEAGLLEENINSLESFTNLIDKWSNQQYLLLRSLKFINFVGGNQMYNQSLWTAGNLKTIKGGMENSAEVAAKFIESQWKILMDKPAQRFLHADYFYFDNKIAVMASSPLKKVDFSASYLINNSGDTIKGKTDQFEHKKRKGISQYAFSFFPAQKLNPGDKYQLKTPSENPTILKLKVDENKEVLAEKKPFTSTLGMGIFGFIPLLGFAFVFFGWAGIIKFKSANNTKVSPLNKLFRILLKLIGYAFICAGIYMLATRGTLIIEMAL